MTNFIDFNERAAEVHELNAKWWVDLDTGERKERDKGEMLMLVVTELAEAAEGERKGLMDDHLPHRPMAEVELADAKIRILDFAYGHGFKFIDELGEMVNALLDPDDERINNMISETDLGKNKLASLLGIVEIVIDLDQAILNKRPNLISDYLSAFVVALYTYARVFGYDLEGAYHEKNEYNKTRKDHSLEARRAPGGKKI